MKEVLENIVNSLVDDKVSVSINEIANEKSVVYEVKVAEKDMGKIIGKQGRIAKAIRTVVKAIGSKEQRKITVEFID